jgi:arsenate reductase
MTTIYHNPRCSKSRATLALLEENGIEPEIIQYLDTPPDRETLKLLTRMLDCSIADIVRKGEDLYRELGLKEKGLSEDELIDVVAANPKLLERPIVVRDGKAVVGRPPENVLDLL